MTPVLDDLLQEEEDGGEIHGRVRSSIGQELLTHRLEEDNLKEEGVSYLQRGQNLRSF